MKLVVFNGLGDAYELGRKFLAAGLYDEFQINILQQYFLLGMYWEIETIHGYMALNNIVPGRDATITILTYDGIKPREKREQAKRLSKETYRKFLNELDEHKKYLFREFGFQRLTAHVKTTNRSSRVLCGRLGFSLEGIVRNSFRLNGQLHDMCVYGILREEVLHGNRIQPVVVPHEPVLGAAAVQPDDAAAVGLDGRRDEPVPPAGSGGAGGAGWWRRFFRWLPAGGR